MAVVRPPVHLAASDYIDPGPLLVEHRSLPDPVLGVSHRSHGELADSEQPVERFVPVRHTVRADHRCCVFGISDHGCSFALTRSPISGKGTAEACWRSRMSTACA